MKITVIYLLLILFPMYMSAEDIVVSSPNGNVRVAVSSRAGQPTYTIEYKNQTIIEPSSLGLTTNEGAYTADAVFRNYNIENVSDSYTLNRCKVSEVHYVANRLTVTYEYPGGRNMDVIFHVGNNDIAFRYRIHPIAERVCCVVTDEATTFDLPAGTTTFLSPQSPAMWGWKRSKPSYEEEYVADQPIGVPSKYGCGYTFPALFHIGDCWALISETGVTGEYCASRLSEGTIDGRYTIAYPMPGENNGFGSTGAQISLPGFTPWRTITIGDNLQPIVETTIPFDVVEELYAPSIDYKFGRATWHWMIWDDKSCNVDDIKKFIDLASEMGYEYTLIDGLWDKQIGYDKIEGLIQYAREKGVETFLWYNSNGAWNDAPQGPRNCMSNPITRKKEMKWLRDMGVKGIKVDFWGGDKQETIRLYEQILSDANDYGIMCIFHGCTLPRGWERMYPNYVGSEAVLASENLKFNQHFDDCEAFNACLHPFIRNAVGSMEFGGTILNRHLNRANDGGSIRRTGDAFQLATAILFQNPIQMFGLTPNNLHDAPIEAMDFMRDVPTTWDETCFIDGYPGRYVVMARRYASHWYVAAINATNKPIKKEISLPFAEGKRIIVYSDKKNSIFVANEAKVNKGRKITITIPTNGGCVITDNN